MLFSKPFLCALAQLLFEFIYTLAFIISHDNELHGLIMSNENSISFISKFLTEFHMMLVNSFVKRNWTISWSLLSCRQWFHTAFKLSLLFFSLLLYAGSNFTLQRCLVHFSILKICVYLFSSYWNLSGMENQPCIF